MMVAHFVLSLIAATSSRSRVHVTVDASEADAVLAILDQRAAGEPIEAPDWDRVFSTEPYLRLKVREKKIAEQFNDPGNELKDDDFKKFVLSEALLARRAALRATLEMWKRADLEASATRMLKYLSPTATIRARVFPVIKPNDNSFVWEAGTNPAIFLFVDPDLNEVKFTNIVTHELHHIGLASAQAAYEKRIQTLPERARLTAAWVGAFGEGLAMLAAAGGPEGDPQAGGSTKDHERWQRDLQNFGRDLKAVDAFFLDVLNGKFATKDAVEEKASSFFGAQGPWYTVGYRMAVIVEKQFGRKALIDTMRDPRRLLVLYNRAAAGTMLPLWSTEVLHQIGGQR